MYDRIMSDAQNPQSPDPTPDREVAAPAAHRRKLTGRKLLVASIGIATVRYVAACIGPDTFITTSANLLAPPPRWDAGQPRNLSQEGKAQAQEDAGTAAGQTDTEDGGKAASEDEADGG